MNETKIEKLLEQILNKLDILTKKETIPQISPQKDLSFLWDIINSNWTSFKSIQLKDMRLFGYYYETTPDPKISEDGWYPLRIDQDGKLLII